MDSNHDHEPPECLMIELNFSVRAEIEDGKPTGTGCWDNFMCPRCGEGELPGKLYYDDREAELAAMPVPLRETLEALDMLLTATVDNDLAHGIGLTESEFEARETALRVFERYGVGQTEGRTVEGREVPDSVERLDDDEEEEEEDEEGEEVIAESTLEILEDPDFVAMRSPEFKAWLAEQRKGGE
jgi:hypothetical protein